MWEGIWAVKPGATLGDVGHAFQRYAEKHGYSVVREYCGYGIGPGTCTKNHYCLSLSLARGWY